MRVELSESELAEITDALLRCHSTTAALAEAFRREGTGHVLSCRLMPSRRRWSSVGCQCTTNSWAGLIAAVVVTVCRASAARSV
jgi:hypothetical protein